MDNRPTPESSLRSTVIRYTKYGTVDGTKYSLLRAIERLITSSRDGTVEHVQEALDAYAAANPIEKPETEKEEYMPKIRALAEHLGVDPSEIVASGHDLEYGSRGWLVMTDAEADEAWEEHLDQYLEDCVLPDVPERIRSYFDRDAWKRNALMDGRGHSLSSYDGNEYDVTVDGETFYLFCTSS